MPERPIEPQSVARVIVVAAALLVAGAFAVSIALYTRLLQ